jgi:hypothetical protein
MKFLSRLLVIPVFLLLHACASAYFHPATQTPAHAIQYNLDTWPYSEYWTGIIFNGEKIGFTHLNLEKTAEGYVLHSQAVIHLNFLGFSKHITLNARDTLRDDLQLQAFEYDYVVDDSRLKITGRRDGNTLQTIITQNDQTEQTSFEINSALYPTGIIGMYPVLHGLTANAQYTYQVYDGETRSLQIVEQNVEGYESSDLFSGNAWRVRTHMLGQNVSTWINDQGLPVFELSLNGVLISALESETMAKRYLASGVINKQDALLDFSRVAVSPPLANPRQTTRIEFELSGVPQNYSLPDDARQQCSRQNEILHCTIQTTVPVAASATASADDLAHSLQIPTRHPAITSLAQSIAAQTSAHEAIPAMLQWIDVNIKKEVSDSFSALDVLAQRKAECQGHSMLYAALARAQSIPTKIVNGLVYSEHHQGFLYHTWAESLVNGHWIAVDPTFNQFPADATHIKLIEGESMEALSKMLPLIGQVKIHILQQN